MMIAVISLPSNWRCPVEAVSHPPVAIAAPQCISHFLGHQERNWLGHQGSICVKGRKKPHQSVGAYAIKSKNQPTRVRAAASTAWCVHTLSLLFQKLRLPSAVITLDCLQSVCGDVRGILL